MDLTVPAGGSSQSVDVGAVGITDAKRDLGSMNRMLFFFCSTLRMNDKKALVRYLWYRL